ncbi:hypothetical protein B0T16DRAFT_33409 [Cercophora newfieldiana]|uniref:Uncharacterized protein n=1 Tax=Cercophora newfieldiana TaxID=92897 RepID=A0AA40D0Z7_9PEZI|nr:hypothetical protein B0T16DRAFT_33409 [Cercophora newfieldiana]
MMHSLRHHAAFWLASASAVATYKLASRFIDESIFRMFLGPLAVLKASTVALGPGPPRCQQVGGLDPLAFLNTFVLLACLGSLAKYIHLPGLDATPILGLIHALLAFSTLGVIEPVREQTRAIEPFYFLGPIPDPPTKVPLALTIPSALIFAYGEAFMLAVILAVFYLLDIQLGYLYGSSADVSCWSIGAAPVAGFRDGNILNILAVPYLVSPIGDIADTVFILVHKFIKPHWIEQPLTFPTGARDDEWGFTELRAVRSGLSVLWPLYNAWASNTTLPESSILLSRAPSMLWACTVGGLGYRVLSAWHSRERL